MLREFVLLRAGECLIDQSQLLTGTAVGKMLRVPIWMYLLRGDDALLLVDTGMPPECVGNPRFFADEEDGDQIQPQMRPDDAVDRVLGRVGLRAEDLDGVISTHWHFDHAGGNRLLRAAPLLVHREEAQSFATEDPPPWVDLQREMRYVVDGEQPMPGVQFLHTPGHTPGHLSLLLTLPSSRPILLTIDACYTARNWAENVPGAMADAERGMRSVARLREIAQAASATVFFGHDAAQAGEEQWGALAR